MAEFLVEAVPGASRHSVKSLTIFLLMPVTDYKDIPPGHKSHLAALPASTPQAPMPRAAPRHRC